MKLSNNIYKRQRLFLTLFALYFRFNFSHRDVEDLLAEREVTVSHEAIRLWCNKFGPHYAKRKRSL
ncbi:MAG: hypothetical protein KUG82_16935 [Pseudomonadales bacterium]|nr:hypothetical protein [Pseudomonadales bacterium]